MEPNNNIENQIREKLNSREIQPSANAWDRLDAMLTVAEEKKTKPSFFSFKYIGIAASVLVFVTLGMFLFNQEEKVLIPNNEIVTTPEVQKPIINKEQFQEEEDKMATINEGHSKISNQKSVIKNQSVSIINQKDNQNPIINRQKEIEFLVAGDVAAVKNIPKVISTEPIIVQPKKEQASKKSSYIDVDALLASAENHNDKKQKTNKINVDVNDLLSNADKEVETNFREKVISKISKNYQEVKTALANRNQE
jgi:hypothetical protein